MLIYSPRGKRDYTLLVMLSEHMQLVSIYLPLEERFHLICENSVFTSLKIAVVALA
jgi:hypothetical protein